MTLIALASIKGSPGVTTAATALAASWPDDRQVLLVEADPFGGDLAPRYCMAPNGGLSSLFAAARRTLVPEDVWAHVDHLPGGLPVLFGLAGMHQATANERAWPVVADALGALDADVVVDVGRLLPNLGGGVREVLARADVLAILCQSTLEAIVHLREALLGLTAELRGRRLAIIPTGTTQFSAADIARTLQVEVIQPLPDDPAAAAALANRRATKRLERTRLLRWAAETIGALGIEGQSPIGSDGLDDLEAPAKADPAEAGPTEVAVSADAFVSAGPTDLQRPEELSDRPASAVELAGATSGSKWGAGR
jgi:MinD-like ATPase involved in chromosome partitioning or flagellar assembly